MRLVAKFDENGDQNLDVDEMFLLVSYWADKEEDAEINFDPDTAEEDDDNL